MKKLFTIIVLISAIALISPKFIGSVVETEYKSALTQLNENPAITINSITFNRDWYRGKVVTDMTVLIHHEEIEAINVVIVDDVSFGPIIFSDEGIKLALSYSKSKVDFTDLFIEEEIADFIQNKVHLSVLLTFTKDIITHIKIDEVVKKVDGNKLMSAKAEGKFVLENETRLYGDFHWDGLSATTINEHFDIKGIQFSLDQKIQSGNYYQGNAIATGNVNLSISTIKANSPAGNNLFLLNNLRVNAISSVKNDLMDINMNYSADKLASAEQQLEHANVDISLTRLDINVIQDMNTFLAGLSSDDAALSAQNMKKIAALTTRLLANDPVIEVKDLSVETPQGQIKSAMKINADKGLFDTKNVMSILAAINASASGTAPMAFFTKLGLAPVVNYYVGQGFIIKKEDNISVNVEYTQGQLKINGNVIQL